MHAYDIVYNYTQSSKWISCKTVFFNLTGDAAGPWTNPTLLALRAADTFEGEVQAFGTLASSGEIWKFNDNHIETGIHIKIVGIVHVPSDIEK